MPKKTKSAFRAAAHGGNLTSNIVEDLGSAIIAGKFSGKNGFPVEADLCVRYGASRSVIREAVKMLTAKGLLAARPRHGTWVQPEEKWNVLDDDVLTWVLARKPSLPLLLEFSEAQLAVECAAAALAAVRASFQQKSAIERALARVVAAEHGEDDPLKAGVAFHLAVLKASGNRFMMQFQKLIETALETGRASVAHRPSVDDHRKVFDAIIAGDADAAYRTMRAMIGRTMEQMARGPVRAHIRKLTGA